MAKRCRSCCGGGTRTIHVTGCGSPPTSLAGYAVTIQDSSSVVVAGGTTDASGNYVASLPVGTGYTAIAGGGSTLYAQGSVTFDVASTPGTTELPLSPQAGGVCCGDVIRAPHYYFGCADGTFELSWNGADYTACGSVTRSTPVVDGDACQGEDPVCTTPTADVPFLIVLNCQGGLGITWMAIPPCGSPVGADATEPSGEALCDASITGPLAFQKNPHDSGPCAYVTMFQRSTTADQVYTFSDSVETVTFTQDTFGGQPKPTEIAKLIEGPYTISS